jgi:hypothetical protein
MSSLRIFARSAKRSRAYPAPEGAGLRRDSCDQPTYRDGDHGMAVRVLVEPEHHFQQGAA